MTVGNWCLLVDAVLAFVVFATWWRHVKSEERCNIPKRDRSKVAWKVIYIALFCCLSLTGLLVYNLLNSTTTHGPWSALVAFELGSLGLFLLGILTPAKKVVFENYNGTGWGVQRVGSQLTHPFFKDSWAVVIPVWTLKHWVSGYARRNVSVRNKRTGLVISTTLYIYSMGGDDPFEFVELVNKKVKDFEEQLQIIVDNCPLPLACLQREDVDGLVLSLGNARETKLRGVHLPRTSATNWKLGYRLSHSEPDTQEIYT